MRHHDNEEAKRLNAQPWQIELLALNPEYVSWGPHEDYMTKEGDGWNSRQVFDSWTAFGPWALDDLNECVNFYFSIDRAAEDCKTCGGNGEHPDAQWVSQSFYSHSSPFKSKTPRELQAEAVLARFGGKSHELLGHEVFPSEELLAKYGPEFRAFCEQMRTRGGWNDAITEDEAAALVKEGRAKEGSTAATINAQNTPEARGFGHDGINRWILVNARCARFGIPTECPTCEGHGHVFTAPEATVMLTLWWLHPRKGCSRGIEVKNIQREQLPAVFAFLQEARKRNDKRFSKLPPA